MTALKNPKYTLKAFTAKSFNDQKDSFKKLIEDAISSKDHAALFSHLEKFSGEKGLVDQAFRELGIQQVSTEIESPVEPLLSLSVECAEKGLCSIHLPVTLLSDILDCLTLDRCEKLFSWVEARVHFWQKDFFFNTCKNRILRTCNDLLRRLSRSQNTVFCGRTLVFLAKIFPLSERSGLNLNSEFNVENTTLFSSGQTAEDGELVDGVKMEEGQVEDTTSASLTVDYNLYRKFWSLQDFFRQPNNCYGKVAWKQFTTYTQEVLAALGSSKLDDDGAMRSLSSDCYFAKYLTNQKLLELELSDSNFRRYVLIQFLILFQYLQANVKSRGDVLTLTEDQTTWVKDTRTKIYQLLEATPPHGRQFAKNIQPLLTWSTNAAHPVSLETLQGTISRAS
ncbi:THOC1 [Cordylochernes scorpioides]|uniref:THOC1 n=1 Tax=Cordylochernes scorpioides TaxID=51811 RepID=A0ABY6L5B6_9ARAC|nr:THOC1 [Cordylochernes scorpioides]